MTNIKNAVTSIFAMIMMLMVGGAFAQGAPWTCDGKFYQVRAPAGSPSTLYSITNPPDNSAFQVTPLYINGVQARNNHRYAATWGRFCFSATKGLAQLRIILEHLSVS